MALLDEDEEDVGMEDPSSQGVMKSSVLRTMTVTLKKMQKMKKGKVLIAIPEKYMYLSKCASLIFGSEPDFAEAKMKQCLPALLRT